MDIHHFGHGHKLVLKDITNWQIAQCRACGFQILGSAYCCAECYKFDIHKSCVELPREIISPFHPQHTLTLLAEPPYKQGEFKCFTCEKMSRGFTFHCSDCKYDLDVHCAGLIPTKGKIRQNLITGHPHPLVPYDKKKGFDIFCSCCVVPIMDHPIYVCRECNAVLDKSCAQLPHKMQHPLHPEHALTLLSRASSQHRCDACGSHASGYLFRCSECDFDLDVRCASLIPTTNKNDEEQDYEDEEDDAEFYCYACEHLRKLSDTTYYCAECHYVAHVHCVISEVWPHLQRVSLALGDKFGKMKLDIARDGVKEEVGVELGRSGVLIETSVGAGIADCTTRSDDSVEKEVTKELRNVHIVSDTILDELDEEIELVHTSVDGLKALKREITRQLEMETMKLDQLKERRDQRILSLKQ